MCGRIEECWKYLAQRRLLSKKSFSDASFFFFSSWKTSGHSGNTGSLYRMSVWFPTVESTPDDYRCRNWQAVTGNTSALTSYTQMIWKVIGGNLSIWRSRTQGEGDSPCQKIQHARLSKIRSWRESKADGILVNMQCSKKAKKSTIRLWRA